MDSLGIIIAVAALIISFISAFVAYLSMKEQRNASKNTAAYTYLATAESLLERHPELFQLHNIDPKLLDECGVTPVELLYLTQSFVSADLYHRIEGSRATLTDYRKNLLSNEKVQKAWKLIIRERLISPSQFSEEVDKYIERQTNLQKINRGNITK